MVLNGNEDFRTLQEKLNYDKLHLFSEDEAEVSKVYGFANDNLREYYSGIDIKDKKILTVLSSADHYLEALRQGASNSNIVTFDINRMTIYCAYMKMFSILNNSRSNFVRPNELTTERSIILPGRVYKKNRDQLPDEIKSLWDLYYYEVMDTQVNTKKLFYFSQILSTKIPYLSSDEKYAALVSILKKQIPQINFHNCDISEIGDNFAPGAFDILSISNIYDYVEPTSEGIKKLTSVIADEGYLILTSSSGLSESVEEALVKTMQPVYKKGPTYDSLMHFRK